MELLIDFKLHKGAPEEVLPSIMEQLLVYSEECFKLKLGTTSLIPHSRYKEHLRKEKWGKMVVLYKTTSLKRILLLEELLIKNGWAVYKNGRLWSKEKRETYYLYVLLL